MARMEQHLEYNGFNGFKFWPAKYKKFANYVAMLPDRRWVRQALAWHPGDGTGRVGRRFVTRDMAVHNILVDGKILDIDDKRLRTVICGSNNISMISILYLDSRVILRT